MSRTTLLFAWLANVALFLPTIVVAQDNSSWTKPQTSERAPVVRAEGTPPALFNLAQKQPRNLVDRLKMLQSSEANEQGSSSRRTASQPSPAPGAPAAPAPVGPMPTTTVIEGDAGENGSRAVSQLPSVLVRGGHSKEVSPTTPAAGTPSADEEYTLSDDASDASQPSSSRRTARRWRSPQAPAYTAPSYQMPSPRMPAD